MSCDTCPKPSSIRVVMSAAEGLSWVMVRMNALWTGSSQPGTNVGDHRPWVQRSSQRMRISDKAALTDRFADAGKRRAEMRATSFRPSVTYARPGEVSCLPSAAASAVAIVAARAWANVENTGLARSAATDVFLRRLAEVATSTKVGVTCIFSRHHGHLAVGHARGRRRTGRGRRAIPG